MKPTSKLLEKESARRRYADPPPTPDKVVYTPEFRAWFGSSKVVDDYGSPKVVHHGSPDLRFLKENGMFLQREERYGKPAPTIPKGFFFVDDYATAKTYADDRRAFDYQNAEAGVASFYLKIENPLILDNKGERWKHQTENSVETAVKGGHDGIIIKNTIDTYHPSDGKKAATVYVVFNSNQIKAAKGNTTFNPAEKSVYASGWNIDLNKTNDATLQRYFERNCDAVVPPGISQGKGIYKDGEGVLIYGTEDGTPVGYAHYQDGRIDVVYVRSDHQKQGIGRKLLEALPHMETRGPYTTKGQGFVEKVRGKVAFGDVTDFSTDPKWHDLFFGNPTPEGVKELASWLHSDPNRFVRLYHGTAAEHDIMGQGLLPTNAARAKSLQSGHGFVYLSVYPDMARDFAKMAYPGKDIQVYAVTVTVRRLLADPDQLRNRRQWSGYDGGNTLAESLVYGHGARIKGKVDAMQLTKVAVSSKLGGFREWFGDSKIVDADGMPLPVYHGSNAKFNSFEKKPGIRGDGGIFEETVHSPFKFFSADPAYAWEVARAKGRGIGNVMKVFLKMDHPLDLTTAAGLAKAYQIFDVPVEDERIAELKDDRKRIAASPLDTKTTYIKYEGNTPVAQSSVPKPGYVERTWSEAEAKAHREEELKDLDQEIADAVDARIQENGMPKSVWDMLDHPESANLLKAAGYDGVILLENDGTKTFAVPDANQIKATNAKAFDPASTNVTAKLASPLYVNSPQFKAWFRDSKVVNEDGSPLRVFRGDARGDKLSPSFNPAKATSGRFYFTSDPEIASNYSTNKPYVPEEDEDYYAWFKFPAYKYPREKYAPILTNIWHRLSPDERERFKQVAMTTSHGDEGVELDSPNGPLNSELSDEDEVRRRYHGNWILAAAESWLRGGTLYDQEEEFGKLFDAAKIPYVYDDPHALRSFVTAVYLSIQNPLDTDHIPQNVIDRFHEMAKGGRNKVKPTDPQWDKANYSVRDWVEKLDYDLEHHTTHAWTVMPEKITKALQSMGYDGIKDTGGKGGGLKHTVWIAFEPNQIKSAIGNKGKFDPKKNNITAALDRNELIQHRRGYIKPDGEFWSAKPGQEHLEMAADAGTSSGALMDKGYIRFVQMPFSHLELQFCLDKAVAKKNVLALMSVIPQYELVMLDLYKMVKGKPEDQNFYGSGTEGAKWLRDVFAGKTPEKPLPPKMAGEKMVFYRGTSQQSKPNGAFWTPSLNFALQFTQSGLESEVQQVTIDTDKTWRTIPELPYGGDMDEIEEAIPEAQSHGCGAIWCSEGQGEPDSIYVFNKTLLKGAKPYQSKVKRERKAPAKAPKLKGQPATEPFKKWFQDSKVVDAKGKPLVVYHGTTHDFEEFQTGKGNSEGHYGGNIFYFTTSKDDASRNYAGEGPDLTGRIEQRAERLYDYGEVADMDEARQVAKSELKGTHEGAVLPVYLSLKNPVIVENGKGTTFELEQNYDEETDEYGEETGTGAELLECLKYIPLDYGVRDTSKTISEISDPLYDGTLTAYKFEQIARGMNGFIDADNGPGEIIAAIYKEMGFDGIIQKNVNEDFKGMALQKGDTHMIAFYPNQIKSALGNKGTFDPNDTRITASYIKHANFLPKKYKFVTDCINADGDDIHDMQDKAVQVGFRTMARNCEGFGELIKNLGYSRDFPITKDWAVSYCKSQYRGVPCYYLEHSKIEYIFTLHGAGGAVPQGDDEADYVEEQSEPMPMTAAFEKEAFRPSPEKLERLMKPYGLTPEEVQRCIEADPTDDLNYVTWIAREFKDKKIRLPEDTGKIRQQLTQFTKLKRSPKFKGEKDIQKYDPSSLYRTVTELQTAVSKKEQTRELKTQGRPGAEVIYNRDGVVMYAVTDPEALMELSSNTNWCTTQEEHATRYLKDYNTIYTIYKNGKPYVQYDPKSDQLMNTEDKDIRDVLPEDADQVFPDLPDARVVLDPTMIDVIEANPQIFKGIECYEMEEIPDEPDACYYYAHYILNAPYPEGEPIIATSEFYSYQYAVEVLKGPFPAGERAIAEDPRDAYAYAARVLKGRFPLAEPKIAQSTTAVAYAQTIIKGRWKEAEPTIFSTKGDEHELYQRAETAYSYIYGAEEQEPGTDWSAAEPLLTHNSEIACRYAIRIKKARFPAAEFYIWANENTKYNYANAFFNPSAPYIGKGGTWPEDLVKQFEARKAENVARSFGRRPRVAKLLTPGAVVL